MSNRALPAGFRAFAAGTALVTLFLVFAVASSPSPAAQVSIVNGQPAKIADWPWQVALVDSKRSGLRSSTRSRFFCGGSLLTPEIVITAGHCVADLEQREAKRIEVISGRTRLNNEARGTVARVAELIMPLRPNGKRRFSSKFGVANWDVALLRLKTPAEGQPIKLAGVDEAASWGPGQVVRTTGWGVTAAENYRTSSVLRVATQVMLGDGVCRLANGRVYDAKTMNCLGGPSTNTSTCFGDSGGPLVAPVGTEYRLIGLTSFGDASCRPVIPSVDSRIAGDPMRRWVRETVLELSGIDPVGSGGVVPEPPVWCKIPDIYGLKVSRAKAAVRAAGCRVKFVQATKVTHGRRGRIVGASFLPGWLTRPGTGIEIYFRR